MKYALRKLIAFVFLGGMFWFVYQDLDNLDKPWFMHALGLLAAAFAVFLLLVPSSVVWLRIARRRRQNRVRYAEWRSSRWNDGPMPTLPDGLRLSFLPREIAYWHEKGTIYAQGLAEADDWPTEGEPSDVAFPRFGRARYLQRTHAYVTNRRLVFSGKGVRLVLPLAEVSIAEVAPGGLVFELVRPYGRPRLAFTFQNPLVGRDVFDWCRSEAEGASSFCFTPESTK